MPGQGGKESGLGRRLFVQSLGAALVGAGGSGMAAKAALAAETVGVFGAQLLRKGRVIDIPPGYYDPERKVFVDSQTEKPMVTAQQSTGIWTCSQEMHCTNTYYPSSGPPSCYGYDYETTRHPDGFSPGDEGGC